MQSRAIALIVWAAIPFTVAQNFSNPTTIQSSQQLQGPSFVGNAVQGSPLKRKVVFEPQVRMMHADSGNSGSTDERAPLGIAPQNLSYSGSIVGDMYWADNGVVFGPVVQQPITTDLRLGIGTFDPTTLKTLVEWFPPDENDTITPTYNQLRLEDSTLLVKSALGRIFTIQRQDKNGTPALKVLREIDVSGYLELGEQLVVAMFDSNDNIWFTSGFLGQVTQKPTSSSTIGYVTPAGQVYVLKLPTQVVENSFAVNGTDVFVITGPPMNSTSSVGYATALTANPAGCVDVLWNITYDAGTHAKPGHFARGSGSSPSVMGRDYFAITDNADEQVNLLVIHQEKASEGRDQVYCKVPLFEKGLSANDVRTTTHWDGENYAVTILNTYNAPPLMNQLSSTEQNGPGNDMTGMPGGITQVQITPKGCSVKWTNSLRMKSVPVLSTASGIFYGYIQDANLAVQGEYVWYVVAIDWNTGRTLWQARTGAGQSYNDNFAAAYVYNGHFYQSVNNGFASIVDKRR